MDTPNHPWTSFIAGPTQLVSPLSIKQGYHVKRLDLLDSWATGNKYYKLKYLIRQALEKGVKTIVSKGGMFSNHLAALSSACKSFDIKLIAMIRSYAPDEKNPSIRRLRSDGHEIIYLSPSEYNLFDSQHSGDMFPEAIFIPEGGLSDLAMQGAAEIALEISEVSPTHVILAGGTMCTACGILSALPASCKLIVVPAWKGCEAPYFLEILDKYDIQYACSWELWSAYHFGGFGKFNRSLIDFMSTYTLDTDIPLDPVYTGKLMYAIHDQFSKGYFRITDRVVAIHTGGLQGMEGFKYRYPEVNWSVGSGQ